MGNKLLVLLLLLLAFIPAMTQAGYQDAFYFVFNTPPHVNPALKSIFANYTSDSLKFAMVGFVEEWCSTEGAAGNWEFDPDVVCGYVLSPNQIVERAREYGLPIKLVLGSSNWMCSSNIQNGSERCIWNYLKNLKDQVTPGESLLMWDEQNREINNPTNHEALHFFSFGRSPNTSDSCTTNTYLCYKERNVRAAARWVKQMMDQYPDTVIAVDLGAEFSMSTDPTFGWADYNPKMIREFKEWTKQKWNNNISSFNQAMGKNYSGFADASFDPPRDVSWATTNAYSSWPSTTKGRYWKEWTDFREYVVNRHVTDMARWVSEEGVPTDRITTHQMSIFDKNKLEYKKFASSFFGTGINNYSVPGITQYEKLSGSEQTVTNINLLEQLQGIAPWSSIEWNLEDSGPSCQLPKQELNPNWSACANDNNNRCLCDPDSIYCQQNPSLCPISQTSINNLLNAYQLNYNYGIKAIAPWAFFAPVNEYQQFELNTASHFRALKLFFAEIKDLPYRSLYWDFTPTGDTEGWHLYDLNPNDSQLSSANGILKWRIDGADSYIYSPSEFKFTGSDRQVMRIRYKISTGGQVNGQLYWITESDPNWATGNKVTSFIQQADNQWREVEFPLVWGNNKVTQFRLDMANSPSAINSDVEIDWVRILPASGGLSGDVNRDGLVNIGDLRQAILSLNIFTYLQVVANYGKQP